MGARLDQHFLADDSVRDAILSAAALTPGDRVVEIGPGRGVLTRELLARGCSVTAVELDRRLAAALPEAAGGAGGLRVVQGDFLRLDPAGLGEPPVKFVANLPYAVATPILRRILEYPGWGAAVLMFQKEVAERIAASPGGPDYGVLTLAVLVRAEPELLFEVPRGCFRPPPRVDSAVVRLRRRPEALVPEDGEEAFFRVARAAFSQRRKMASGGLSRVLGLPRPRVAAALSRLGIPEGARPAEIPFEAFLRLPAELGVG